MQTNFSLAQLADPKTAEAESILRRCVHCGFCLATCPTYLELGNELDSAAWKNLPHQGHAGERQAGIDGGCDAYRPLPVLPLLHDHVPVRCRLYAPVDHARVGSRRLTGGRSETDLCAGSSPAPFLTARGSAPHCGWRGWRGRSYRAAEVRPGRNAARDDAEAGAGKPAAAKTSARPGVSFTPEGKRCARVALLHGCAQAVLDPGINIATVRLLSRFGVEVVFAEGEGCCGSIVHHMGRERQARPLARDQHRRMDRRDRRRGARRYHRHHVRLRDDHQGLWPHFSARPVYARKAARVAGARARRQRISRDGSTLRAGQARQRPDRRLPFRLLAAARAA